MSRNERGVIVVFKSPVHSTAKKLNLDQTGPEKTGLSVAVVLFEKKHATNEKPVWIGLNQTYDMHLYWDYVPIHIPSILLIFLYQKWLRIEQDMTKYIFIQQKSTILVNMIQFNLFLSQILTDLGDIGLILKR